MPNHPIRPSFEDLLARIEELQATIATLTAQVAALTAENATLTAENAALKDKLNIDSTNSSLPPSMDLKRPKPEPKSTGRKRGGQKGHKGHHRALLPPEQVSEFVPCPPPSVCTCCGGRVELVDHIHRIQQTDIPPITPIVKEYQIQHGRCTKCRKKYQGALPKGVKPHAMGPALTALAGMLRTKCHVTLSGVQYIFKEAFNVTVSLGCLSTQEGRLCESLAPVHGHIREAARNAPHLNKDETSYREGSKRTWAWILCNEALTYIEINASRSKTALHKILGPDYQGLSTTDRYPVYNVLDLSRRQICWAHLKRNFERFAKSATEAVAELGAAFLAHKDTLFAAIRALEDGVIDRITFLVQIEALRVHVRRTLERGASMTKHENLRNVCKNVLKLEPALWLFASDSRLEPTNNRAERDIRSLVIGRKNSYHTQSERGTQRVERLESVSGTCKKQGVGFMGFLKEVYTNWCHGQPPPHIFAEQDTAPAPAT
jgi:transposase